MFLKVLEENLNLKLARRVRSGGTRRKNYGSGAAIRDHHSSRTEVLLESGLRVCGLQAAALSGLPCNDERKALVALVIKRRPRFRWTGSPRSCTWVLAAR